MALLSSINKLIDNKVDFITAGMILILSQRKLMVSQQLKNKVK